MQQQGAVTLVLSEHLQMQQELSIKKDLKMNLSTYIKETELRLEKLLVSHLLIAMILLLLLIIVPSTVSLIKESMLLLVLLVTVGVVILLASVPVYFLLSM